MSDFVLGVANLGKCYATYSNDFARFARWFGFRAQPKSEYWALRNVSFALSRGEALAIIGQNGAGKSTLLKLVTGTVRQTVGSVQVNGRISAMLELGLGFNPDLTARQNVYLAGGLMGIGTTELGRLIPDIESFAEIGSFFDQPLRVFSTGMQARLAFAVATAVRPEVLIVDEVLSVGDSYFQHKSFARIKEFSRQGTSILFVTHALASVRALCDRVILLDQGIVLKDGLPDEVVDYYNALIAKKESATLTIEQRREKGGWLYSKSGRGDCTIVRQELQDAASGAPVQFALVGQRLKLILDVFIRRSVSRLVVGYMLRDRQGHVVWGTNTWHTRQYLDDLDEGQTFRYALDFTCTLGPGSYAFTFALHSSETHLSDSYEWTDNALVFDVVNIDRSVFIGSSFIDAHISITPMIAGELGAHPCEPVGAGT